MNTNGLDHHMTGSDAAENSENHLKGSSDAENETESLTNHHPAKTKLSEENNSNLTASKLESQPEPETDSESSGSESSDSSEFEDPDDLLTKLRKSSEAAHTLYLLQPIRDALAQVELQEADVVIAGFPKSGTNWVEQICHQIRTKGTDEDFEELTDEVPLLQLFSIPLGYDLNAPQKGDYKLFKTHDIITHLPSGAEKSKILLTLRNPHNTLCSYYKWEPVFTGYDPRRELTMEQFFQYKFNYNQTLVPLTYWQFLQHWLQHIHSMPSTSSSSVADSEQKPAQENHNSNTVLSNMERKNQNEEDNDAKQIVPRGDGKVNGTSFATCTSDAMLQRDSEADHLTTADLSSKMLQRSNCLVVFYEDLCEDFETVAEHMRSFLGTPLSQTEKERVRQLSSFEYMKQNESKFDLHGLRNRIAELADDNDYYLEKTETPSFLNQGAKRKGVDEIPQSLLDTMEEEWNKHITSQFGYRDYQHMRESLSILSQNHPPNDPATAANTGE